MTTKTIVVGLVAAATMALAACGGTVPASAPGATGESEPATSEPEPPPPTVEAAAYAYSTDPAAIVLDLTSGGGFVPAEVAVDTRPTFRMYGDGTVLVRPEETELGFPVLRTYTLTSEGIEAVLAEADAQGLLAPGPDYGMPPVTDLPSTTLTIALADGPYTHSAYALGFDDSTGLTAAQAEARGRYQDFTTFLTTLETAHPELVATESAPYEPQAVRVYAWERDPQPGQKPPAWPLADGIESWPPDPVSGARCAVISGSDLETLMTAVSDQQWPYAWRSGGTTWSTGIALQLPGDAECSA